MRNTYSNHEGNESSQENFDMQSIQKVNADISFMQIQEFLESLDEVGDFSEFIEFKKKLNNKIMEFFAHKVENKPDEFQKALHQWNIDILSEDDPHKETAKQLVYQKNRIYNQLLYSALQKWIFNKLLTTKQIRDIQNIISSWILEYFDELFLNFEETAKQNIHSWNLPAKPKQLYFGGVQDWEYVPYKNLIKNSRIDMNLIEQINDENLRSYLAWIVKLLNSWVMSYDDWLVQEEKIMQWWKQEENPLWIIAPIEDYVLAERCIEPEVAFILKDISLDTANTSFLELSRKFFGEGYQMEEVNLDFVEPVLEWWDATFSGFIWKAFPNDPNLAQKYWNAIIIKLDSMNNVLDNAQKAMHSFFGNDFEFDKKALRDELIKEVTYHEFWHSLFIKWHPKSLMEELKATLFYFLKLYDENQVEVYNDDEIKKIVEFAVMDSIRNIQRMDNPTFQKYLILTKVILFYLFENNLLEWWDNDRLTINTDSKLFLNFLENLKKELDYIKYLYELDDQTREQEENTYLQTLQSRIDNDIDKMYEIIINS